MMDNEAQEQLEAAIRAADIWYGFVIATSPSRDVAVMARLVGMHAFTAGVTWQRERDLLRGAGEKAHG